MQIQSNTPCKNGFQPTCLSVSRVSDAPMKKSESVMRCFARLPTDLLNNAPAEAICSAPSKPQKVKKRLLDSTYVLSRIATMNHTIKFGMVLYHAVRVSPS